VNPTTSKQSLREILTPTSKTISNPLLGFDANESKFNFFSRLGLHPCFVKKKNPHKIQTAEGEELSNGTRGPSYYILKDAAFQLMI
jgi:hypothetical protein